MSTFVLRIADLDRVLDKFIYSKADGTIIIGPLGSGKTWGSCQRMFLMMIGQRPDREGIRRTRFFAVRNTYSELKSTTIKEWKEFLRENRECTRFGRFYQHGSLGPPTHVLNFRLSDKTRVQSEVVFIALDRPKDADKIRGSETTGAWLNEVKLIPELVVSQMMGRCDRFPPPHDGSGGATWPGLFGDTNSPDKDHWLYKLAEETPPEINKATGRQVWEIYRQPGAYTRVLDHKGMWTGEWAPNMESENRENLKPGYYEKMLTGNSEDWIAVNLANEYGEVMDGKGIYRDHWSEFMHLDRDLEATPGLPLVVGIDPGVSMAAVVTQAQDDGSVRVLDEICKDGAGIEGFIENHLKPLLARKYSGYEVEYIIDPAAENSEASINQSVLELIQGLGIYCLTPNIPNNDIDLRLEAVRHYLNKLVKAQPAFKLSTRCRLLKAGFNGGYQFKRVQVAGDARFRDKPDKNKYSHPHDALQYAMLYHRGQFVNHPDGDFDRDQFEDDSF